MSERKQIHIDEEEIKRQKQIMADMRAQNEALKSKPLAYISWTIRMSRRVSCSFLERVSERFL